MNRILNRSVNLLLLLVGMESLQLLFTESFGLRVGKEAVLWLGVLCVLLWFSASFRHGAFCGLPLCACVLYYLYRSRTTDLIAELQDMAGCIVDVYYGHFGGFSTGEPTADSHFVAVLLMMFLVAAFLAVSMTAGSFRIGLSELGTLPLFASCIAVNGTPSVQPVLGMLVFWIGVILSGDVYRPEDAAGKGALLGILPVFVLLVSLLYFWRPNTYVYTQQDINLAEQFDRLGQFLHSEFGDKNTEPGSPSSVFHLPLQSSSDSRDIAQSTEQMNLSNAPMGWYSDTNGLDLTQPFNQEEAQQLVFRLYADQSGGIYLRGRSFGDYTGTSWGPAAENLHGFALDFASLSVAAGDSHEEHHFRINNRSAYANLYLPYYSISEYSGDVSVPSEGRSSYGGDYLTPSSGSSFSILPEESLPEEQSYREYVYNYYTRLPDQTRAAMQDLASKANLTADRADIISAVAAYIRQTGTYDLSVAAYPTDDYALYFLTQSHRGYCIHFATAAAVLYRSLGIPARLTEGYLAVAQHNRWVQVTGANAHAWVEVWMDGIGWIPVEVTTSQEADFETSENDIPHSEQESPSAVSDESEVSSVPQVSISPYDSPVGVSDSADEPDKSMVADRSAAQEGSIPNDVIGGSISSELQNDPDRHLFIVLLVCLPFMIVILFFGRFTVLNIFKKQRLSVKDNRKLAVNLYREAIKLQRHGTSMPESIINTAERASFSQHAITDEELKTAFRDYGLNVAAIKKERSRLSQLWLKYWYIIT